MTFNQDQNQLKGVRVYDPPAIFGHIELAWTLECINRPLSSTKKITKKTPKRGAVNGTPREHHIITSKSDIYEYIRKHLHKTKPQPRNYGVEMGWRERHPSQLTTLSCRIHNFAMPTPNEERFTWLESLL